LERAATGGRLPRLIVLTGVDPGGKHELDLS